VLLVKFRLKVDPSTIKICFSLYYHIQCRLYDFCFNWCYCVSCCSTRILLKLLLFQVYSPLLILICHVCIWW